MDVISKTSYGIEGEEMIDHTCDTPVDKNTAMAMSGGCGYQLEKYNVNIQTWEVPPKMLPVGVDQEDLTGREFGRMRVVGRIKGKWVCRCSCGLYEARKAKSINNPRNQNDACHHCRALLHLKRRSAMLSFKRRHGVWPCESSGVEARRIIEEFGE